MYLLFDMYNWVAVHLKGYSGASLEGRRVWWIALKWYCAKKTCVIPMIFRVNCEAMRLMSALDVGLSVTPKFKGWGAEWWKGLIRSRFNSPTAYGWL